MPIGQQQSLGPSSGDPNSASQPRQLFIRDLEPVVEGAGSALEAYPSTGPVHLFEYVTVRKGRERALFLLDDALLLCTVKSKKRFAENRFEYNKFKLQALIRLETVDLRCACWQHWVQEAEKAEREKEKEKVGSILSAGSSGSFSGPNRIDRDLAKSVGGDLLLGSHHHHFAGSSGHLDHLHHHYQSSHQHQNQHQSQQQQLASSGCRACIETLEADIKALLKLQSSVHQITTASIRAGLSSHLTEVVQSVYSQLVEMHETVARCAKDLSVDVYILPTTSSNSNDNSNSVVDPGLYAQGGGLLDSNSLNSSSESPYSGGSSSQQQIFTHHSTSSNSNQITKSVRLVHYKCPRHQPHRFSFNHHHHHQQQQQQQQQDPEYTFTFADCRRRATFELLVTSLRAQIIRSRLKLHFLRAIPYE